MKVNGYTVDVVCSNAVPSMIVGGHPELTEYTWDDTYDTYEDFDEMHPDEDMLFVYEVTKDGNYENAKLFESVEEAVDWALEH